MDLNTTLAFVTVVECESFSAAARTLEIPRSTVSARVAALEAHLGTVLLRRTTRRIALTDDGRDYFERVAPAIAALREAAHFGAARATVLTGSIRMSVPFDFPFDALSEAITTFRASHPQVRFDVVVDDSVSDFVDDNLDMAIRGGHPGGDHVIARRIASFRFAKFASPAFGVSRKHATPDVPQLAFKSRAAPVAPARSTALSPPAHYAVATNSFALLKQLALRGAGAAVLPEHTCEAELTRGELVRYPLDTTNGKSSADASQAGLYLVYPSRRELSPRVKAFSDHLVVTLENAAHASAS
ncbi:HTH-type transcriptional regulator DmlR [Pandoraea pneumonica]|jgi:DNA-binding transcriptional LysR family regulator|uniref:HTH-type transcriptional regulator DmlR n=1 Tax=Pandoraea pneumonica TaxID=2508299 RepID=A0A5E4VNT8_9BURK|nr:LysR family transcriptional regulator [Pandoraea pneumonica]VVE14087.1 HTH-type transcriptional regulator DmlR [Pandoraea pneumonica]